MGKVRIDPKKNRIYIILTGRTLAEYVETVEQIEEATLALKPNFTCLTDLRYIGAAEPQQYREILMKGQQALAEIGIGKSVRLITEDQLRNAYFQNMEVVGPGYGTQSVTSMKEAERILNGFKREMDQLLNHTKRTGRMFKIMDPGGGRFKELFLDFGAAVKRLRQIRRQGHRRAIVVDVNCDIANGNG